MSDSIKLNEIAEKLSNSGILTDCLVMNRSNIKQMVEDDERRIREEIEIMNIKQENMSLEEFAKAVESIEMDDGFSIEAIQNKANDYKKELDSLGNELSRISSKFGFSRGTVLFDLKCRIR